MFSFGAHVHSNVFRLYDRSGHKAYHSTLSKHKAYNHTHGKMINRSEHKAHHNIDISTQGPSQ